MTGLLTPAERAANLSLLQRRALREIIHGAAIVVQPRHARKHLSALVKEALITMRNGEYVTAEGRTQSTRCVFMTEVGREVRAVLVDEFTREGRR